MRIQFCPLINHAYSFARRLRSLTRMGVESDKCKEGCSWAWGSFLTAVFEYDTAKIVHIKNKKVGLMNRVVQLGIVGYIIGYGIIYQKGYQKTGNVAGTVTTKMKGAYLYENDVDRSDFEACKEYFNDSSFLVFDPADYVIPPQEPDSFFVMTNMWVTCGQKYGTCPESPDVHSKCKVNSDCIPGQMPIGGNGPNVGTCNNETKTCDIRAWCPTEYENETITHSAPLIDASNFTVLIKNSIRYPALLPNDRKRNILPVDEGTNYLRKCHFSTDTYEHLYCPIMSLQYIVDNIVHSDQDFTELSILGGVVGIEIRWDCDLDWKLKHCNPKYTFRRLDDPNVGVSPGFNFRFANYYVEDGAQARTLYKAYGILFKVVTIGKGGMFDFTTLVLKIGSMIALLGIAVVVSDVIVLYVLKKRNFYKQNKYQQVIDSDDDKEYEVINNPPDVETPATKRVNYSSNSSSPQESDKF